MAAWERVKTNKGTCGIDEETIEEFESSLKGNLYKLWNQMPSGTYFPPPVSYPMHTFIPLKSICYKDPR